MSPSRTFPGDLEWMVLLTTLNLGEEAHALTIREEMIERAGREVSRGTLYETLSRMESRGRLAWEVDETDVPDLLHPSAPAGGAAVGGRHPPGADHRGRDADELLVRVDGAEAIVACLDAARPADRR